MGLAGRWYPHAHFIHSHVILYFKHDYMSILHSKIKIKKKKREIRHLLSLDFLGDTIQGPGSWMLDLVTRNLRPSQAPPGFLGVWAATHSLRMDLGMKSAL